MSRRPIPLQRSVLHDLPHHGEREGGYQLSSAQYAQRFVYPDDLAVVGTEIEKALTSTDRHYSRQLDHRILYADGGVGYISVSINIDRMSTARSSLLWCQSGHH